MVESKTVAGCKDDLVVDASRCQRMRFSESGCRRCFDICPHGAVMLDGGLAINPDLCRGCLLCTAVCPVGALEQSSDFHSCLVQLSKVSEPVLGCLLTKECANGTIACLGGLAEEHLLTLYHSLTGKLTLNLSMCGDCLNNPMIAELKQRLDNLAKAGLSVSGCRIVMAEMTEDIHYHDESVDRRSFFKSFRNSLFKSAAIIISNSNDQTERRTEYAGKRLPRRRELVNSIRKTLSPELEIRARKHFDKIVAFENTCTGCLGCVAICPSGALKTEAVENSPAFDQLLCTGCGLCREFCLDQAVQIFSVSSEG